MGPAEELATRWEGGLRLVWQASARWTSGSPLPLVFPAQWVPSPLAGGSLKRWCRVCRAIRHRKGELPATGRCRRGWRGGRPGFGSSAGDGGRRAGA